MAGETSLSGSVYGGVAAPCAVILFGASGDLAKRKVIPAMYDLATHNALGPRYAIVGFARTVLTRTHSAPAWGKPPKRFPKWGRLSPSSGMPLRRTSTTARGSTAIRKPIPNWPSG